MKKNLASESLMTKAVDALSDARILLEQGSLDGAANRAYYAMFNAARAALSATEPSVDLNASHDAIIGIFGKLLVKTGIFPKNMGRAFNDAFETRITADYDEDFLEYDEVSEMVTQAKELVQAVQNKFFQISN